ncbi:DNA-directed RNA polymerase subunit omega [Xylanibacillus composti]|uniref:DNA-directed RNA polymerase subunit omega n=1 Tax=Xylanibacillus composti TaxID=1572762 RepID=A0A8J4M131_9BACL|nr:DNA-directed RNA polymerase subunit omega [Xylanibacillus composti]MDT9725592.1 DNA-directed RNA polymerase subunit omega [Xylanibacillus composti]GIQ67685.1 DNA-directed RNA polymerase subunit omega [Xylanibacillus composti]
MLYPSIDEMLEKVDSKYSLVVAAAKRARKLRDGARSELGRPHSNKYVGIALEEIYHDIVKFENKANKSKEA